MTSSRLTRGMLPGARRCPLFQARAGLRACRARAGSSPDESIAVGGEIALIADAAEREGGGDRRSRGGEKGLKLSGRSLEVCWCLRLHAKEA